MNEDSREFQRYTVCLLRQLDDLWCCYVLEFPGCMAHGTTAVEAMAELSSIASAWVRDLQEEGEVLPEPLGMPAWDLVDGSWEDED